MNDDNVVVPEITPNELSARFELGHAPVLVDVRELFEREIVDLPQTMDSSLYRLVSL